MFSIGIFSTYLPYVLLAMFYGLYIGVHSIMKFELGSDQDKELAAKTIFKDHADAQPGADSNNFHCDQFFGAHSTCSDPVIHRFAGEPRCSYHTKTRSFDRTIIRFFPGHHP